MKKKLIFLFSVFSILLILGVSSDLSASEKGIVRKLITLSGYLSLSGTSYISPNTNYVTAYVTGWLTMRDSSGNYHTNNTYINTNVSFWLNNSNYVSTTAIRTFT